MQIVVSNVKGGCGKSTIVASLADMLDANIIDHDVQGTLKVSSHFTGRHKPVTPDQVTKKIVIHDTPPYKSGNLISLLKNADIIIIPCKLMYPDFLALKGLSDELKHVKLQARAIIVYNEIRQPINSTYKELKQLYDANYPHIKKANTELSNLLGFSRVLARPLCGKALKQMQSLIKELNIQ